MPKPAMPVVTEVDTPVGPARLHAYRATSPRALLVLGHGAGRGTDTADLLGLARDLPGEGVAVVLVDQPWVLAGRKVAAPPPTLDVAWLAAVPAARKAVRAKASVPLVVGGRSAGARVACRTSVELGASGVLLLAFPLAPPSAKRDPAGSLAVRRAELAVPLDAGLPVVVAQGARDTFGGPDDIAAADPRAVVVAVAGADHGLKVPKSAPGPGPVLLGAALDAVRRAVGG
jgi:predicted alpha/beta-hydrolase family hydrolase